MILCSFILVNLLIKQVHVQLYFGFDFISSNILNIFVFEVVFRIECYEYGKRTKTKVNMQIKPQYKTIKVHFSVTKSLDYRVVRNATLLYKVK